MTLTRFSGTAAWGRLGDDLRRGRRLAAPCAYLMRPAPDLLATAKAPWEPAGNARTAHRGARRPPSILNPGPAKAAGGKTFDIWDGTVSSIPAAAGATHPGVAPPRGVCGPWHFLEALGQGRRCRHKVTWFSLEHLGALVRHRRRHRRPSSGMRSDVIVIDDIGLLPSPPRPPRRSTGSSTPPTRLSPRRGDHRQRHRGSGPTTIAPPGPRRLTAGTASASGKGVTPLTN